MDTNESTSSLTPITSNTISSSGTLIAITLILIIIAIKLYQLFLQYKNFRSLAKFATYDTYIKSVAKPMPVSMQITRNYVVFRPYAFIILIVSILLISPHTRQAVSEFFYTLLSLFSTKQ